MNILYVCRSNSGDPLPFVKEQAEVLHRNFPISIQYYLIKKGIFNGYVRAIFELPAVIKKNNIQIIHVHNGLSAFAVILCKLFFIQRMKVVITFHGSDINRESERKYSLFASRFSSHNIVVSTKMAKFFKDNYSVVPCGIDTGVSLNYRDITRREKSWEDDDFIILFSSNFNKKVKDPEFAFEVINKFSRNSKKNILFLELVGYNREQLTQIMQAADALILCSKSEGSPQVIKESILNGLPVVSNDVGDVAQICKGVDNCFIVEKNIDAYVACLQNISQNYVRVQHREPVLEEYDNNKISNKLFDIYCRVLA